MICEYATNNYYRLFTFKKEHKNERDSMNSPNHVVSETWQQREKVVCKFYKEKRENGLRFLFLKCLLNFKTFINRNLYYKTIK